MWLIGKRLARASGISTLLSAFTERAPTARFRPDFRHHHTLGEPARDGHPTETRWRARVSEPRLAVVDSSL